MTQCVIIFMMHCVIKTDGRDDNDAFDDSLSVCSGVVDTPGNETAQGPQVGRQTPSHPPDQWLGHSRVTK